jgi:hypothetical protein
MADVKISALPASTTPLAGTEVLPIVQGGQTRQVSVNNLTAGKAISATQYTSTIATGTAPLVVASTTEVANLRSANATSADTANQVKSNATTGVLQIAGPAAAATRVMTTPDANFTVARTDAAQTFNGLQTFNETRILVSPTVGRAAFGPQNSTGDAHVGSSGIPSPSAGFQDYGYYAAYNALRIATGEWRHSRTTTVPALRHIAIGATNGGTLGFFWDFSANVGAGDISWTNLMRLSTTGDLSLASGNLVIGTSGKGIDFSANPNAPGATSELLNDYETGTWTPTFVPSGTGFDAITYNAATGGRYTKVGNVVHVQAWLQTDSTTLGSASGVLRVGGFPFTSVANTGSTLDGYSALSVSYASSGFVTAAAQNMHIRPNGTVADMYYQTGTQTGPNAQLVVANMGAGTVILQFSGTYIAA